MLSKLMTQRFHGLVLTTPIAIVMNGLNLYVKRRIIILTLFLTISISVHLCEDSAILDSKILLEKEKKTRLRYILLWIDPDNTIFADMGVGQRIFIERKCRHVNCYVTSDRHLLENITMFDVVAFSGDNMRVTPSYLWPKIRSPHQKYTFVTFESDMNFRATCNSDMDGFFNWTWTFRLDSESKWVYFVVTDLEGNIIGPNIEMHWIKHEDMLPVPEDLKLELKNKTKLAAWFASNCETSSKRELYIEKLQIILTQFYNHSIDIYGHCGKLKCPRRDHERCHKLIRDHYYFYLAFENAIDKDYVTEKVLHALQNNAVPIVYGGANYSRFLPPGSYIDATKLSPYQLSLEMRRILSDFEKYVDFFRWKNHYLIHPPEVSPMSDLYCSVCELINDDRKFKEKTVYRNFRDWWNPHYKETVWCWPYIVFAYNSVISYMIDRIISFPSFLFSF